MESMLYITSVSWYSETSVTLLSKEVPLVAIRYAVTLSCAEKREFYCVEFLRNQYSTERLLTKKVHNMVVPIAGVTLPETV